MNGYFYGESTHVLIYFTDKFSISVDSSYDDTECGLRNKI